MRGWVRSSVRTSFGIAMLGIWIDCAVIVGIVLIF